MLGFRVVRRKIENVALVLITIRTLVALEPEPATRGNGTHLNVAFCPQVALR